VRAHTATSPAICTGVMPRIEPKSALSKDGPLVPNFANRATPSAKDAIVITPMAASAPTRLRLVTAVIASADAIPQRPAPMA